MQDIDLEQPFTAHLQVHNASSDPVEDLVLSLPAEEIPGLGMRLMVIANLPYCAAVQPLNSKLSNANCLYALRKGEGGGGSACHCHAPACCTMYMQRLPFGCTDNFSIGRAGFARRRAWGAAIFTEQDNPM